MDNSSPWYQISPELTAGYLDRFLKSFELTTIWEWTLLAQDEFLFRFETQFIDTTQLYKRKTSVLDLSWGNGRPIVSRRQEFSNRLFREVGIPMDYLFRGTAKARNIINEVANSLGENLKFDLIRVYLIAQHLRHHGVLLTGLKKFLKPRGFVYVYDSNDKLLRFHPTMPFVQNMYDDLRKLQKKTGGHRAASDQIKKRASMFGYRLEESALLRCQSQSPEDRLSFFRVICLHIEIITRYFPNRSDRLALFNDIKEWYAHPDAWGSMGLHLVVVGLKAAKYASRRPVKT